MDCPLLGVTSDGGALEQFWGLRGCWAGIRSRSPSPPLPPF